MLRRLGLMLLFVLEVKKCFTKGSQKVLAFLWLISFRYGFFRFLALSATRGGGGYSHTLPIQVCAAQRGRDFEAPDLERGIHFRGVF